MKSVGYRLGSCFGLTKNSGGTDCGTGSVVVECVPDVGIED